MPSAKRWATFSKPLWSALCDSPVKNVMFVVDVMNDDGVIVFLGRRLAGQAEVVGERRLVQPNHVVGPLRHGDECRALGVGDACADLVAVGVDDRDR